MTVHGSLAVAAAADRELSELSLPRRRPPPGVGRRSGEPPGPGPPPRGGGCCGWDQHDESFEPSDVADASLSLRLATKSRSPLSTSSSLFSGSPPLLSPS
jgi:hypothetical protein